MGAVDVISFCAVFIFRRSSGREVLRLSLDVGQFITSFPKTLFHVSDFFSSEWVFVV